MSTTSLSDNICSLYTSLTGETNDAAMAEIKRLAADEAPQDHWLETNKLSYESRLFLCAAVAFAMRSMKDSPYKCAVFTRNIAEALHAQA